MSDDYVLLASSDGYTFSVPRRIAIASGMLKSMLDEDCESYESGIDGSRVPGSKGSDRRARPSVRQIIYQADFSGIILLKIIEYLAFKVQYADWDASEIREDFQDRIDPYIALELWVILQSSADISLTAADYLEA